jgi:RHS repeat-associated protein
MLSFGGASTTYDGLGNRVAQTVSATVTRYLLDMQPGLAVVLSETTGVNTTRYVHGPRGIHAQKDSANVWEHPLQDGLGSVRGVTDNAGAVLWATQVEPYGTGFGTVGTAQTNYGFTGEYGLPGGLVHLRARNYHPGLGVFTALDPFEGMTHIAMSLNRFSYVYGNPVNISDASGMFGEQPGKWNTCYLPVSKGMRYRTQVNRLNNCGADQANRWAVTWGGYDLNEYVNIIESNKDLLLQEAASRLNEIRHICSANFAGPSVTDAVQEGCQEFQNMTVEEFAARSAAIPLVSNVAGWMEDRGKALTIAHLAYAANLIAGSFLWGSYPAEQWLELQSAGFLELRYREFTDVMQGNTLTAYQIAPVNAGLLCMGSSTGCYLSYASTSDQTLLIKLAVARYANHTIQFFDYLSNPVNAEVDVDVFINGGSTRWAARCSRGTSSGSNNCSQKNDEYPDPGGISGFHVSIRVMRQIFGSHYNDCLIPSADSES